MMGRFLAKEISSRKNLWKRTSLMKNTATLFPDVADLQEAAEALLAEAHLAEALPEVAHPAHPGDHLTEIPG